MTKIKFKRQYLAFPYAVISAIFVIIPLFVLLYYAFTDKATGSLSFANFITFFTTKGVYKTLGQSFLIALLTTIICLLLAYPLAYILSRAPFNKHAMLVMIFVMPMWINSLLRMYAVKEILFIFDIPNGFGAVLIGMVYDFFPFMLLPLYTALSNIDKSYVEASSDLGAKPHITFLKITLPLSIPGIISGILMVFMPTISTFAVVDMLGDASVFMFGNLINNMVGGGNRNLGAAYSLILLVLVAITILISNLISNKGKGKAKGGLL